MSHSDGRFDERKGWFSLLHAYAEEFHHLHEQHPDWVSDDPRFTLIGAPESALMAGNLNHGFIEKYLADPRWWRDNEPLVGNPRQILRDYRIHSKYSTFVMFFSYFESEFRRLYRMLFPGAGRNGTAAFRSLYESMLANLGMEQRFADVLSFATDLRNAMHNNGHFYPKHGGDVTHNFRGETYSLKYGEPIGFATPLLLHGIYSDILELSSAIVAHDIIQAI